ncbi:MAG: DEAD/DEAH box helicase [Spirochaetia bacterium]|jgi:DEAD/DEAH box helicase domain-containing protein|nr:DEAD/DEAH box helicase [Spirochaetia bacterium]
MSDELIKTIKDDFDFKRNITHWETIKAREGIYSEFPDAADPLIRKIYEKRGITRLYTHQRRCFDLVREGKNTVVVTPTASGKTLCYNLPVIDHLLKNPEARALYLFPTKALSQDQQSELNEVLLSKDLPIRSVTYDGDTPSSVRVSARDGGRIIITNPDMLHSGIMPNHPKWIKFLSNVKFIVIDEVHIYRGVFGSHVTNVIRRLKRICRFYGSDPLFICCSATIGNPLELTEKIIETDAVLVDENGSPSGEKHFILYNPPLVDAVQGIRRGVVLESQSLALKFLLQGIKTIVFCRSRIRTELIAGYINQRLKNVFNDNNRVRVESYRGGYLPGERREIEKGLRNGEIQGVVSTNALELGIDIGGLDASIMAGFPGSISSSWQQAGRAGRRASSSVSVLIASNAPVDQYVIGHPDYFFGRNPESAWIDPDNIYIQLDHLKCAAFELPFAEDEIFGKRTGELLSYLEEEGILRRTGGKYYWADRSYPAESVSLRSATSENVVIIDTTNGKNTVIGEMDRPSAKEMLFDNAVYIHRGEQFIVKKLDIENKKCLVENSDLNYYTDAVVKSDIKLLTEDKSAVKSGVRIAEGDVLVRKQVTKFKKIKYMSHENIGFGEISLPEEEMHTRSVIFIFDDNTSSRTAFDKIPDELKEHVIGRIGSLIKNVSPVFLLCDSRDIGFAERLRDPHFGKACIYIYDNYPGGTGLAEGLSRITDEVLNASFERIRSCPCNAGCPSCIGPDDDASVTQNKKEQIIAFFSGWLGKK